MPFFLQEDARNYSDALVRVCTKIMKESVLLLFKIYASMDEDTSGLKDKNSSSVYHSLH